MLTPQLPEHFANGHTNTPSDATVNFIKNKGGDLVSLRQYMLEGQHQARGFTTRGDFCQRLEAFTPVGFDKKFNQVYAMLVKGQRFIIDSQTIWIRFMLQLHLESGFLHLQSGQLLANRFLHGFSTCLSGLADSQRFFRKAFFNSLYF